MKKVIVRESTKTKTEAVLKAKGIDVEVLWDTAYRKTNDINTRIKVMCNVCGDIEDYSLGCLTCGTYKCDVCLLNKYTDGCEKLNLKLIKRLRNTSKDKNLLVECPICGEQSEVIGCQILKGIFRCNGCITNKYIKACYTLNLKFLGKNDLHSNARLNTECNICGHRDSSAIGDILMGKFRCNGCLHNKYTKALESKGCSLLRIEKRFKKRTRIHYTNAVGDSFVASANHVARGNFESSTSGYWYQKHAVYLIRLQVEGGLFICKIGTANDPTQRAKDLKLNKNYDVFTLASFETRFEADKLESELHREFASNRLQDSEVLEHTEAIRLRKNSKGEKYRIKDGITEWFSSEVFDILSQRYNLE